MSYLIFENIAEAEIYQEQVDTSLGYPEDPNSLTWVGGGVHCPKELGLALHYDYIIKHLTQDQWTLHKQDENTYPCPGPSIARRDEIIEIPITATEVVDLPEGWLPT